MHKYDRITTRIDKENHLTEQVIERYQKGATVTLLDLRDTDMRQALIDLGWTPPQETKGQDDV